MLKKPSMLPLLLFISSCYADGTRLPEFFTALYDSNSVRLTRVLTPVYLEALQTISGISNSPKDRDRIGRLLFYHLLFTSTDATDCSKGGILEIPYFWHWVDPNPRHELTYVPLSAPLSKIKPPPGFENYRSYADADRTPALYLSNLVTDTALFYHPGCGNFYTFGWCSEREMAFSNLMTQMGYVMKIRQEGIHVRSEAHVAVEAANGPVDVVVKIDNTFNTFELEKLETPGAEWRKDLGEGTKVRWYNSKALSQKELRAVGDIRVSDSAKKRISSDISEWLRKRE